LELIEEEAVRVAMILSKEEENCWWAGYDVNLPESLQQQRRPTTPPARPDKPPQHARDNSPAPPHESHGSPPHSRL
jgi:hypothetical protein